MRDPTHPANRTDPARPRVLVLAFSSARMIAQLAAADGWEVIAFDRFGDHDLRAVASGSSAPTGRELAALAAGARADALVYGAGLENHPELVDRLAQGRELLGVGARALAAVRDPWALAAAARAAGVRAPETRVRPPAADLGARGAGDGDGWLRKPLRSGGGHGVRRWAGGRLRPTEVLQRRVDGMGCSAVAIGDGRRAVVLGLTEQLLRPRSFGWIGNVTPPRLPESQRVELSGQLQSVCDAVADRFGVRGAFGVDVIWDGRRAWVLEVNPRPTASLELFARGTFSAHVLGARGFALPEGEDRPPLGTCTKVKLVLFADRDLRAPSPAWWPAGLVRDIPAAGTAIARGQPVCTLVADTDDVAALAARGARLLAALGEEMLAHG